MSDATATPASVQVSDGVESTSNARLCDRTRDSRTGLIFGECGTDNCTNKARWIPTSDIPVAPQPFVYRCPECCDRIDAERRGQ